MPHIYAHSVCVSNLGTSFPCGVENAKKNTAGKEGNNKLMGWCNIQKKGWTPLWKHLQ